MTARPPQKGSTRRRDACSSQIGSRWGTSQRFPPAHLRGGEYNEVCWAFMSLSLFLRKVQLGKQESPLHQNLRSGIQGAW